MNWFGSSMIVIDSNKFEGKPYIAGTYFTVQAILDMLAGGMTGEEILQLYPPLMPAHIQAVLSYASYLVGKQTSLPAQEIQTD